MRDYNKEVTFTSLENFVNYAIESGYEVDCTEGVLNDTYVIYNHDKKLSIKGVKPREYIVLYPKFLNAWANSFHVLMTDDEKQAKNYLES